VPVWGGESTGRREEMREIQDRRSIRKYSDREIDEVALGKILESARLAPSGHNRQPWHFIVVKNPERKRRIAEVAGGQTWMLTAPVFIVCVADIRARIETDEVLYIDEETPSFELKRVIRDTAVAIGHILLEATALGLGTCWVGWYLQKDIRPILDIPPDKFVLGVITVGYADEAPGQRPRKSMEEMLHRETW